jgi:hypothetical protein
MVVGVDHTFSRSTVLYSTVQYLAKGRVWEYRPFDNDDDDDDDDVSAHNNTFSR